VSPQALCSLAEYRQSFFQKRRFERIKIPFHRRAAQTAAFQTPSEVRKQGLTTPAVALSAYARAEDRVRSAQTGYQTHLVKPVEPAELLAVIASLAGRYEMTAQETGGRSSTADS